MSLPLFETLADTWVTSTPVILKVRLDLQLQVIFLSFNSALKFLVHTLRCNLRVLEVTKGAQLYWLIFQAPPVHPQESEALELV